MKKVIKDMQRELIAIFTEREIAARIEGDEGAARYYAMRIARVVAGAKKLRSK